MKYGNDNFKNNQWLFGVLQSFVLHTASDSHGVLSGCFCFVSIALLLRTAGDTPRVCSAEASHLCSRLSCLSACTVLPAQGPVQRFATLGRRRLSIR